MRGILIWIIFLITTLTLASPLIDRILNGNVLNVINNWIDNLEFFIWSNNTNTFLIMISVILIFTLYRRAGKFIHHWD